MTDHTTPRYTATEARAILRGLGAKPVPALSTLRRWHRRLRHNDFSLLEVVQIAIERGVTEIRMVPQFGKTLSLVIDDGLLSITPGVVSGACCIDGTRVPTWCMRRDPRETAADYGVTLEQAKAAHRWETACREKS